MSITISDCLKLAALKEARVAGGHGGLKKIVAGVSVLEYAALSALENQLFLGNELIITAFVSIKDNVNAQCQALRRLHEMGEVGLVLYYVGIYVPAVDSRLVKTANELDFPLIVMPINKYSFRYSEVISEVLYAVFIDQNQEGQEGTFVAGIIDRISQLKEQQRTFEVVLRILCDRLHCSFLISDRSGDQRAFAAWPMAAHWEEEDMAAVIAKHEDSLVTGMPVPVEIQGRRARIFSRSLEMKKQKGFVLIAVDENESMDANQLRHAAEALQLFANIWDCSIDTEGPDALLRAILGNQPGEMRRISRKLCINVESINTMRILTFNKSGNGSKRKTVYERFAAKLTKFLKEYHNTVLVDVFNDFVVSFTDAAKYSYQGESLGAVFLEELEAASPSPVVIEFFNLKSTEDVRSAYTLMEENLETTCKIYERLTLFGQYELEFARACRLIIEQGESYIEKCTSRLAPLREGENGREMIDTLAVYLLDAQGSAQTTADMMFVHKNTVKYRVNKIKSSLGYDFMKMPEMLDLYTALGVDRLLFYGK